MIKRFAKNNKKGLTLPVAIVISIVLVIVAAGLVFIALSSISTTSVTVNGRQAFMDVRSALEYVESYYYNYQRDFSTIGNNSGVEYFSAQEEEGPTGTAVVKYVRSDGQPNVDNVKTYVEALYTAAVGSNPATLKLTGYSHYSDDFGNSGKSVSLSVTFTIGASGSQRRVTVINLPKRTELKSAVDSIKLHLKKPADLNWTLCYYIWTYKDEKGAYTNTKLNYYNPDGTKIKPDVDKMNGNEWGESQHPNGKWLNTAEGGRPRGANGLMTKDANGWYSGDYKINSEYVNYFNVIFANQGALLKPRDTGPLEIYDTQLNEIFHLWYLDPDDKNIFFEFLNNKKHDGDTEYYTKYYTGTAWDGKKGLDDTIVVYLRNQKTTVHFRAINDNNNTYENNITALNTNPPKISYVGNSDRSAYAVGPTFLTSEARDAECTIQKKNTNITMTYEGCGWWVASVETKKTFDVRITYRGVEYSLPSVRPIRNQVAPDAVPETWILLKERVTATSASYKYLQAHSSEKTALSDLGISGMPYVTIHAKNYEPAVEASPKLSYKDVITDSSVGRTKLYDEIAKVKMLNSTDYENYTSLFLGDDGILTEAQKAYNEGEGFIKAPKHYLGERMETKTASTMPGGLTALLARADSVFQEYINALEAGMGKLRQAVADKATIEAFEKMLEQADNMVKNPSVYDAGQLAVFTSAGGSYQSAKTFYNNNIKGTVYKSAIAVVMNNLREQINALEAEKLDRLSLKTLIERIYAGNYINDDRYDETLRNGLQTLITDPTNGADALLKRVSVTQEELDAMESQVRSKLREVEASRTLESVDLSRINILISEADNKMLATENFTEASKSQLQTALEDARSAIDAADATQESVDNARSKLQLALYRFDVIKPAVKEDVSSSVDENKTRIWFNRGENFTFELKKLNDANQVAEDVTRYIDTTGNTYGTSSGLSCITLTNGSTKKIKLFVKSKVSSANDFASDALSISTLKDTDYLYVDYANKRVLPAKSTVLFVARRVDGKTIGGSDIKLTVGGKEIAKATTANYYVFRFPSSIGNNGTLKISESTYGINWGVAGEYVIWLNGASAEIVKMDDIEPKPAQTEETPGGSGGNPTHTIAPAEEDYEIRPVVELSKIDAEKMFDAVKANVGVNDMCILYSPGYSDNFRINLFGDNTAAYSEWDNRPSMMQVPGYSNHYYFICDKKYNRFQITNHEDSGEKKVIDGTDDEGRSNGWLLPTDSSGRMYEFYQIESSGINQRKHIDYDYQITANEIKESLILRNNEMIIILQTFDSDNYKFRTPRIGVWGTGKNNYTKVRMEPGYNGHSSYYYYICNKEQYDHFKVENGEGTVMIGDTALEKDASHKLYDYYVVYQEGTTAKNLIPPGNKSRTAYEYQQETVSEVVEILGEYINESKIILGSEQSCVILDAHELIQTQGLFGSSSEEERARTLKDNAPFFYEWKYSEIVNPDTGRADFERQTAVLMSQYIDNSSDGGKYAGVYFHKINEIDDVRFMISTKSDPDNASAILIKPTDLPNNPSTGKPYKYYIVKVGSNNTAVLGSCSDEPPKWIFESAVYSNGSGNEANLEQANLAMAYVGGGKIRVKNKSYYLTYGSGQKANSANDGEKRMVNFGTPFGGSGRDDSDHRVGDSMLTPYYDWFEYKIPVEESATYSFMISGLDPDNADASTPLIAGVSGNLWVSLYNNQLKSTSPDIFKYTELSTFDTDIYQSLSEPTLYFKLPKNENGIEWSGTTTITTPEGTLQTKNSMVLTAHGVAYGDDRIVEGITVDTSVDLTERSMEQLGRVETSHIYKVTDISKNTPFITVRFYGKKGNEFEYKDYNIKLQGGTKVLFNPNMNGGLGGWEDFISDQDDLMDVCQNLLDMYFTKTIVHEYDKNGEIVDSAQNHASTFMYNLMTDDNSAYKDYFTTDASHTLKVNVSEINGKLDLEAYNAAESLRQYVNELNTLYVLMSNARSYIDTPIVNGSYHPATINPQSKYPEYLDGGGNRLYDGVESLKGKLAVAELAYLENGELQKAIGDLDRAIVNLKLRVSGSIAVVLYDAQSKVAAGHGFQISYKTTSGGDPIMETVSDLNPEGYPIIFIKQADGTAYEAIYDVQFYDTTTGEAIGNSKTEMKEDEAWVFMDYAVGGEWRENTLTDYRDVTADEYEKVENGDDVKFRMKRVVTEKRNAAGDVVSTTVTYEPMTIYFEYDTTIKCRYTYSYVDADGISHDEERTSYLIKSGAYTFNASVNATTNVVNAPAPLSTVSEVDTESHETIQQVELNLFTAEAANYFTTSENYQMYTEDAVTGQSMGWWSSNTFSPTQSVVIGSNVNLDVSRGSFAEMMAFYYSYSTDKGINFRWSSVKPLYVGGNGVRLYANEFRFGSVGTVDGLEYNTPDTHFYLYSYDDKDSVQITFLNDIKVEYRDNMGTAHSFVIREGDYIIEKEYVKDAFGENTDEKTEYIADLFNETYWKSLEHVRPLDGGTDTTRWGRGNIGLSNPVYGG